MCVVSKRSALHNQLFEESAQASMRVVYTRQILVIAHCVLWLRNSWESLFGSLKIRHPRHITRKSANTCIGLLLHASHFYNVLERVSACVIWLQHSLSVREMCPSMRQANKTHVTFALICRPVTFQQTIACPVMHRAEQYRRLNFFTAYLSFTQNLNAIFFKLMKIYMTRWVFFIKFTLFG